MIANILSVLYTDPQTLRHLPCPDCGSATYPPGYSCIRCRRDRG